MRKLLLFACALFGFMACTQNPIEEQSAIRTDAPETIRVGFEDDVTRIQLNEAQKTVWTKDDLVSVFYLSNANQKWQYQGETGERVGNLKRVENATATAQTSKVVVVYPYRDDYYLNYESCNLHATLPATQYYTKGSYGVGSNLMVSQSEFTQFSLKSVCGWLKLQLSGNGEVVKSIKFRGNNDEQVAGLIYVDTATAEATLASEMGSSDDNNAGGNLIFDDTILTEVTLDCGEGVTLGAEATPFYISLPPQTFANGFTVEIECEDYKLMTLTTEKELVIERNTIQPMASVEHNAEQIIPNNQIWYTSSNGKVVTPHDTNAFGANIISNEYNNGMGVITFNRDVTSIGNSAFRWCRSLTSVNIPDSVTTIGEGAFERCTSLTSVNIPDSVTTIGDYAFDECYDLTSVTIGDSVTKIGNQAFCYCSSLTSVNIPDSVTTIGDDAFERCTSLTSVNIPDSVTMIGYEAFSSCFSLTSVTIGDSVTSIGNFAFAWCDSLTSVTIGNSVTTIGDDAFRQCTSLTSVNIPDSVTTIGENAFVFCTSLTSVNIPDSVTSIGEWAFSSCTSLKEFKGKYATEDGRSLIVDNTIIAYANTSGTTYNIPDSVTTIGDEAFYGCSSLTSVTIPDSVTSIGEYAFCNCDSLTSVNIPDSVTSIGEYAFCNCDSLTSVNIPDSVTTIGNGVFYECDSLTSVNIPDSVTTIGYEAFYDCTSLKSVNIPDSVTTIGRYAFDGCSSLTSVTIPDSVTTIGEGAFNWCESLTSVTIGNSVTTIGEWAFGYCGSLTSVNIGDSVTTIGNYAFYYCSSLTSVYCKATTPPALGMYVFYNNGSGRKIYVPVGSVEAYKSSEYWSEYASAIVGYNF